MFKPLVHLVHDVELIMLKYLFAYSTKLTLYALQMYFFGFQSL